jgi:hypothetical protein
MLNLSKTSTPVTLLSYPKLTTDAEYLFNKLRPILGKIDFDVFDKLFKKTVKPELVHSFNPEDT